MHKLIINSAYIQKYSSLLNSLLPSRLFLSSVSVANLLVTLLVCSLENTFGLIGIGADILYSVVLFSFLVKDRVLS